MAASETHGGTFGYENREEKKEETKGIREWPWSCLGLNSLLLKKYLVARRHFGVTELILVARRDFNAFGSHGSASHVRFRHFHSLIEARNYLKDEKDCDICGVEIADGASAVNEHPFKRSTAFLLGNERSGLSAKEYEICDFFVYIPQYGCGTASLNVTVAASIVLHHFGVWAGFSERVRDGSKFIVADRPLRQGKRNICAGTEESIVEERKLRKENAENGFFDEDGNGNSSESSSSELLNGLFLNTNNRLCKKNKVFDLGS
ncbi:unnamed protein product [Brassica oleracea]